MTATRLRRLAASGAVAGLAPTTEADLGDGTFPARDYVDARGAFGIGSDSNTMHRSVRRVAAARMVAAARARERATCSRTAAFRSGRRSTQRAARGGAQALAQPIGAIARGPPCRSRRARRRSIRRSRSCRADDWLDAAIFGPCTHPVRDVMVGGRWVVRDGRHSREADVFARYRAAIAPFSAA